MAYDPSGGNWKDVNRSVWQSNKWMKGSVKEDCKYYQGGMSCKLGGRTACNGCGGYKNNEE